MSLKILESQAVKQLEKRILEALRSDTRKNEVYGALSMFNWMSKNFTREEFELMEEIEVAIGEEPASQWFWAVMRSNRPEKFQNEATA